MRALLAAVILFAFVPAADAALTFTQAPLSPLPAVFAGSTPQGLQAADFDGDGKVDVAVMSGAAVRVYLGTGAGAYAPAPQGDIPVAGSVVRLLGQADFDADGDIDLATIQSSGAVRTLTNDGTGAFAVGGPTTPSALPFVGPAAEVRTGRLNGDAVPDVLYVGNNQLVPLFATGAGTFSAGTVVPLGPGVTGRDAALADFDADGDTDAIVITDTDIRRYLGDGMGNLTLSGAVTLSPVLNTLAVGNFGGDARPDVVVDDGLGVRTYLTTDTPFAAMENTPLAGPEKITAGDLDGNGFDDLATVESNRVLALLSTGDGSYVQVPLTAAPQQVNGHGADIADVDRDGLPDIIVSSEGNSSITTLLNRSTAQRLLGGDNMNFGAQNLGGLSGAQVKILANDGHARLKVGNVRLGGANPGQFVLTSDGCGGETLAPSQTCVVGVRFAPDEHRHEVRDAADQRLEQPDRHLGADAGHRQRRAARAGRRPGRAGAAGCRRARRCPGPGRPAGPRRRGRRRRRARRCRPRRADRPAGCGRTGRCAWPRGRHGPKGERGPDGPAGPAQVVVCKTVRGKRREIDVKCSVTAARSGTARLLRGGHVVRRVRVRAGRQVLRFRVGRPGVYRVRVR